MPCKILEIDIRDEYLLETRLPRDHVIRSRDSQWMGDAIFNPDGFVDFLSSNIMPKPKIFTSVQSPHAGSQQFLLSHVLPGSQGPGSLT